MPVKNVIKQYLAGRYYHIYNRGVNRRRMFLDEQDYAVFLSYFKTYLLAKNVERLSKIIVSETASPRQKDQALRELQLNNFYQRITLLAYILMTNHFHFLIQQRDERDIKIFMQSLMTRYTRYFNKRHNRVGTLLEGIYKAVPIETDRQLIYLTRYIHRNDPTFKQPSSLPNYLGEVKQDWVKPGFILQNFSGNTGFNSYREFVASENTEVEAETARLAGPFFLDKP